MGLKGLKGTAEQDYQSVKDLESGFFNLSRLWGKAVERSGVEGVSGGEGRRMVG